MKKKEKKNKKKLLYKGDSSYLYVPGSAEVAHNALRAYIYRFSNDGPHFKAEIVDPQNWPKRHLCHDIVLFVFHLCRGLQCYVATVFNTFF